MKPIHKLTVLLASALAAYAFGQPNSAVQFYDSTGATPTSKFGWQGSAAAGKFYIEMPNSGNGFSLQNGNMTLDGNIKATSFTGNGSGLTGITAVGASATEVATTLKTDAAFVTSVKGATGPQGPIGPTGPTGATGPAGSGTGSGTVGPAGPTGPTGPQGLTGPAGANGLPGAAGTNGTNGVPGAKGDQGATGLTGATGAAGSNGTNGVPGAKGDKGDLGLTGSTGATGPGFALGKMYEYFGGVGNYGLDIRSITPGLTNGGAGEFHAAGVINGHGKGDGTRANVAAVLAGNVAGSGYAGYFAGRVKIDFGLILVGGCDGCNVTLSDRKLKKEIVKLDSAAERLEKITGVSFYWNEKGPQDSSQQFGVIAQDVQRALPAAARLQKSGNLSVEYNALTALLIEGFKEQRKTIQNQQKQIDELVKLIKK